MVDVDGTAEMLDSVSRSDIRKPMEAHPSLARRGYLSDGKFNTLASPLLMPLPLSPTRTQEKNLSWESIQNYLKDGNRINLRQRQTSDHAKFCQQK
jgi:hypothetical protein